MRVRFVIVSLVVTLAAACGGDSTGTASGSANKTVDVFTVGDTFSPAFASISVGDTVRWNFAGGSDGQGHNVRFTAHSPGSPADLNVLKTGTATRTFTTKGTFSYVCDVHPGMSGEVIVE